MPGYNNIMSSIPQDNNTTVATAIVLLTALYTVSLMVKLLRNKHQTNRPWPKVEGALPIIGNFHQLKEPKNFANKVEEWADEYSKETGVYEVNIMGVDWVVVCSEERVKELFKHRPYKVTRHVQVTDSSKSIGANGIFSSEGELWKSNRRLVAPFFNQNHVRDYMHIIKVAQKRLLQKWTDKSKQGQAFAMNEDIFSFALDYTAMVVLGKDFDSLNSYNSEAEDVKTTFGGVLLRSMVPFPFWKIPFIGQYLDGVGFALDRLDTSLKKIVDGQQSSQRNTLVQKVVAQSHKDSTFDRDRIIGNLKTTLFAGTDSSAATLISAIQMVAEDKTGLQQELVTEIEQNIPANLDDITFEHLEPDSIPRLKSFCCEVGRYFAVFSLTPFHIEKPIPFCGTTLKKGSNVMALLRYVSCNPHSAPKDIPVGPNGEDNTEFCPRRFLVKEADGRVGVSLPKYNSTSFLSFGHGVRACPGKKIAETSMALTLSVLLRSFKIELAPDHEAVGRVMELGNVPDKDIRIVLTPR